MKHWLDELPFYVAGTLPDPDRAALEDHLRECDQCRDALREWQQIADGVRTSAAARVRRLPALRQPHRSGVTITGNGRVNQEKSFMLNTTYIPSYQTRSRQPVLTLAAALLLVIVLGSVLLAVALQNDKPSTPAGGPAGNNQMSGSLPVTASPTTPPTPLDITATFTATTVPVEISATPFATSFATQLETQLPPTVIPAESGSATPTPAALPLDVTATFTATPFLVQPVGAQPAEPPVSARLDGVPYEAQTWNNQGPANLSMALRYCGWDGDQQTAAAWLKPDSEDKSVSPWQMVYYANRFTDYKAIYRLGGTTELLRRLIGAGFPVIIQTGIQPEGEDWLGHYRLIWGYEGSQKFLLHDSFLGQDLSLSKDEIDDGWREFAYTFIVVYDPARAMDLRLALGAYADPVAAAGEALRIVQAAAIASPDDAWSHFSLGTAYVTLSDFEHAVEAYDRAFELGLPWRMLWYQSGPFEAYFHTGDYQNVIALADHVLATADNVEDAHYWRGMALSAQGAANAAGEQFARVVELNPNFFTAQTEYFRLESAAFNLPPQMINAMGEMPRPADANHLPPTAVPAEGVSATPTLIPTLTATPIPADVIPATPDYTATAIIETATPIVVEPVVSLTPTLAQ